MSDEKLVFRRLAKNQRKMTVSADEIDARHILRPQLSITRVSKVSHISQKNTEKILRD